MSAWNEFVTASLLGTEKPGALALPEDLETMLGEFVGSADLSAERQFLLRAGALALWRRAGFKPAEKAADGIPSVENDERQPIPKAAVSHLYEMLAGRFPEVLPEWFSLVRARNFRLPFELLPAALQLAGQKPELREDILACGGSRAKWLAALNPGWRFGSSSEREDWETGSKAERLRFLRSLREKDPAQARALVSASWKAEPADVRAAAVEALEPGLSMDDEPFLEAALDDRSKEVRRVACRLVSTLAESRLVARMRERAAGLLTYKPGRLLSSAKLEVTLPNPPDAAAVRDGVDAALVGNQKQLGERALHLVQIIGGIPPSYWTTAFGEQPEKLISAARKTEFSQAIITGWALAALHFHDESWAEALLEVRTEVVPFILHRSLTSALSEPVRAAWLIRELEQVTAGFEKWEALSSELLSFPGTWPVPLAHAFIETLRKAASSYLPWALRSNARTLLCRIPASLCGDSLGGWHLDEADGYQIAEFLNFRREAVEAITK